MKQYKATLKPQFETYVAGSKVFTNNTSELKGHTNSHIIDERLKAHLEENAVLVERLSKGRLQSECYFLFEEIKEENPKKPGRPKKNEGLGDIPECDQDLGVDGDE
jgi:hypothetical protein